MFVVADVRVHRDLLVAALANEGRIEVAGCAHGDVAAMAVGMADPGVVVFDPASIRGQEGLRALAAAAPSPKLVALGIADDESAFVELAEVGVAGYVTAEQPLAELVDAIEAAASGELRCSPRVSAALRERVAQLARRAPCSDPREKLTRRQREIAELIADDLSNKQIARRLSIERATVKNHVHAVLAKLGLCRRDQVAALLGRQAASSRPGI